MGTEIKKKEDGNGGIRKLIESDSFKEQLARALPKHLTADRFVRIAYTAMIKTPKLMECTQASIINCLLTLSQMGLEPDGRDAHLVPYGTECQVIVDYKGLINLMLSTGDILKIDADVVRTNDIFDNNMGMVTVHKIDYRKDRGDIYAAYAIAKLANGETKCEIMDLAELEKIHQSSKAKNSGPWVTWKEEMYKKCPIRRLAKFVRLSNRAKEALENDFDSFESINTARQVEFVAAPVNPNARKQADHVADPSKMIEEEAPEYIDVWGTQDEEEQEEQPQQRTLLEGLEKIADERQDISGDEPPAFSATVQKLWDALEGDSNKLEKLTAFTDKEGKQVPGTRSFVTIKDKRAAIALRKWEESPEFGK